MFLEEQLWYYLTHNQKDKGVHAFPMGIFLKVSVIVRLEFELAYYDSAVQRFLLVGKHAPVESLQEFKECIITDLVPIDLMMKLTYRSSLLSKVRV